MIRGIDFFLKWIRSVPIVKRLRKHFKHFSYIWVLLIVLFIISWLLVPNHWEISVKLIGFVLALLTLLLLIRPMNAVYGLMGTSGSIILFFFNFIIITLLFAGIYDLAFFKDAGISYDVNQPHIDYALFASDTQVDTTAVAKIGKNRAIKTEERRNTLHIERQLDTIVLKETIVQVTLDTLHYQKINFWQVWRSSILTTLTQEPAELLTSASVYNDGMGSSDVIKDRQKSSVFEWILIFHTIISWIFFGMFISLLYNKFRYES